MSSDSKIPIRILIADDHTVVRKGLCALLGPNYGLEVVAEAGDGLEAVEKARATKPDVILMDLIMPRKTGLEAIVEIREKDPDARILVLSSFGEHARVAAALEAGALGFVPKDSNPDELIHAIRSVHMGILSLPQNLAREVLASAKGTDTALSMQSQLTRREMDVLRCLGRGMSNQEIAEELVITKWTVRSHVHNLLEKLGLSSRTQAALYAVEIGLVVPGSSENSE